MKKSLHPYVSAFKRGVPAISFNLFNEAGMNVPVTPMAIFGTHYPFLVPVKIRVNVGEPMYISADIKEGSSDPVDKFRDTLERRVKSLFSELIRS